MSGIIFQLLIIAYGIALQDPVYFLAASLPEDDSIYINSATVEDINGDGMPEVCLSGGGGWEYRVYYYLDEEVHSVEQLMPWTWSSELYHTKQGTLVLYATAHTTGTAGNCQYRIYDWTQKGYVLREDLWRLPDEWEQDPDSEYGEWIPITFLYLSSTECIDPFHDEEYANLLITETEYERKITELGELTSIVGCYDGKWVYEREREQEDGDMDEIYMELKKALLDWKK